MEAALSRLTAGAGAIAAAARDISDALSSGASTSRGASTDLARSVQRTSAIFRDLEVSISPGKLAFYQLSKAIGQLVAGQVQTAGQLLKLNRTIYESDDVFGNMNAQFEVGQKSVENLFASLKTGLSAIPLIGAVFGETLQPLGAAALEVGKEHFQRIISTSKTVSDAFKKTNEVFGPLTHSMDEFTRIAGRSGLDTRTFGKILTENAVSLRTAFGTLSGAAEHMSQNFKYLVESESGKEMMMKFKQMGYGVDEIAASLADYSELQAMSGNREIKAGQTQVESTYAYVKNLKVLQAISGEDIKTQTQKRKQEAETAIYQSRIRKIQASADEAGLQKFESMRKFMSLAGAEAEQAAVAYYDEKNESIEQVRNIGSGAPVIMEMIRQLTALAEDTTVSADEYNKKAAQLMQGRAKDLEEFVKRSTESTKLVTYYGVTNEVVSAQANAAAALNKNLPRILQLATNVDQTNQVLEDSNDKAKRGQLDELELQNLLSQIKTRTKYEQELIDKYKDSVTKASTYLQELTKLQEKAAESYGPIAVKIADAMIGFSTNVANVNGGLAGLVGMINKIGKENLPAAGVNKPEGKVGGILSGPIDGYEAILHGKEAVIPLPNGRSVPVEIDTTKMASAILASIKASEVSEPHKTQSTENLSRYLEMNNSVNQEILRELKRGNEISERIYRVTV